MMGSSTSYCSELNPGHINHIVHDRHTAGILLVADLGIAKVKGMDSFDPAGKVQIVLIM